MKDKEYVEHLYLQTNRNFINYIYVGHFVTARMFKSDRIWYVKALVTKDVINVNANFILKKATLDQRMF